MANKLKKKGKKEKVRREKLSEDEITKWNTESKTKEIKENKKSRFKENSIESKDAKDTELDNDNFSNIEESNFSSESFEDNISEEQSTVLIQPDRIITRPRNLGAVVGEDVLDNERTDTNERSSRENAYSSSSGGSNLYEKSYESVNSLYDDKKDDDRYVVPTFDPREVTNDRFFNPESKKNSIFTGLRDDERSHPEVPREETFRLENPFDKKKDRDNKYNQFK